MVTRRAGKVRRGRRATLVVGVAGVVVPAAVGAYVGGYGDSPGTVLAARGH